MSGRISIFAHPEGVTEISRGLSPRKPPVRKEKRSHPEGMPDAPSMSRLIAFVFSAVLVAMPVSAPACAVCFGGDGSQISKGLTLGIFALLGVVFTVLGGIAAFFIYLAKRSRALNEVPLESPVSEPVNS